MTEFITSIPDDLKCLVDSVSITKRNIRIHFVSGQIVVERIISDVSKFKNNIRKSLKDGNVQKHHINEIISLLQNNYAKIYPDEDEPSSDTDQINTDFEGQKNFQIPKPDITFEEWQSKLKEKYDAIKETCNKNFPGLWHYIEFKLSILRILNIKGCTLPFAGIVLRPPSSSKTLGIELFREYSKTHYSDSFTPKSFVSHSTNVKKEDLGENDMLLKIKGKCFLAPELSPIFSKKDDDLMELLGILTSS